VIHTDDTICILSAALIIIFQVFVYHCSHNITQILDKVKFWYNSHKFFYIYTYISHTLFNTTPNAIVPHVANLKTLVSSIHYL